MLSHCQPAHNGQPAAVALRMGMCVLQNARVEVYKSLQVLPRSSELYDVLYYNFV